MKLCAPCLQLASRGKLTADIIGGKVEEVSAWDLVRVETGEDALIEPGKSRYRHAGVKPVYVTAATAIRGTPVCVAHLDEAPPEVLQAVVARPGDTLILSAEGPLTDQEQENIRTEAERYLPGLRVAILEGMKLGVYRSGQSPLEAAVSGAG